MKLKNYNKSNIKTHKIVTKLNNIDTHHINVNGWPMTLVFINTTDGKYSGFYQVWNKQGIDSKKLNKGDCLEIEYVTSVWKKNGKTYNNFKSVKVLPNINSK